MPLYFVCLKVAERQQLEQILAKESYKEYKAMWARFILKADDAQKTQFIAIVCSVAPVGRVRWTLKLRAQLMVELEIVGAERNFDHSIG